MASFSLVPVLKSIYSPLLMERGQGVRLFLFLLLSLPSLAQTNNNIKDEEKTVVVSGTVRDRLTGGQLIDADVMLYDMRDTLIDKTKAHSWSWDYRRRASVEKADFNLRIPRLEGTLRLRIAAEEHDTLVHEFTLADLGKRELNKNLGSLYLTRQQTATLSEVSVTATKVKFYNRSDTLVFNADAFQLAEGSMLDALLKQLPGVELKEGGEIYVNGKKVESLLLNGKDFFRGDNQLMLDNLAAYTVKNVEVYKKQTDRDRFLGNDSENDKLLTMDVKMKKEYIGGWTGNIEGGGGTESRYLGRLFAMHFTALSQFTLIGNINNLNSSSRPTSDDEWQPEFRPNGTKQYKQIGATYASENNEGTTKVSGNAFAQFQRNENSTETNATNFLQTMNTRSRSLSSRLDRDFSLNSDHEFYHEFKGVSLSLSPYIRWRRGMNDSESQSATYNDKPLSGDSIEGLINSSRQMADGSTSRLSLGGGANAVVKIPKTSDALDLNFRYEYVNETGESNQRNVILYGDPAQKPQGRNSLTQNGPNRDNVLRAGARYHLRLSPKVYFALAYNYNSQRYAKHSSYYLGQVVSEHTGDYTMENLIALQRVFDPTNSNTSLEHLRSHQIQPRFNWKIAKQTTLSASGEFSFQNNTFDYDQNSRHYFAQYKKAEFTYANARFDYGHSLDSLWTSFHFSYDLRKGAPALRNMVELENTRDPLTRYLANPDLKSKCDHRFNVNYHRGIRDSYNFTTYADLTLTDNDFVSGYTYDTSTGQRIYRTYNVSGRLRLNAFARLGYTLTKWLDMSVRFRYGFNKSHSMIGENSLTPSRYAMRTHNYEPYLGFIVTPTQKIRISLSSEANWNVSNGENPAAQNLRFCTQKHNLSADFKLPLDFALITSLMLYKRTGMDDPKMNTTEWIWNARISKGFLKNKLVVNVTAYDLLRQIQTVSYYVTATGRTETITNTIPRYILFHLQYKFNIKPKKKIAQATRFY